MVDTYGQKSPPADEITGRVGPGKERKRAKKVAQMDRAKVAEMIRKGFTFNQIAAELGVSRNTAIRDWKIVLNRLRMERELNGGAYLDLELAQLSQVKREAYEEWQRQKGDYAAKITKQILEQVLAADMSGEEIREIKITYKSEVDPALLAVVLNTIKQECRLLNLGNNDKGDKGNTNNFNLIWQQVVQSLNGENKEVPKVIDSPKESTQQQPPAKIDVEKLIIEGIPKIGVPSREIPGYKAIPD